MGINRGIVLMTGFEKMLSCAQHWSTQVRLMDSVGWMRLIVSQYVCAFISSRDRIFPDEK
jgi:hypothetical protein